MLRKSSFLGEENKETLKAFNAKTINQLGKTAEERKKVAQIMQDMGFLQNADAIRFDENGNAIASSITPTHGDQLAKAVGTSQGGKLGENLKAMIISDAEVKNAGESVSATKNNQYAETGGSKFDAGWKGENIQKDIKGAAASEAAEFGMSPKEWVKGIAAMGHDKGVEALQGLGYNSDEAENLYNTITSPAVGVAGTVAIAEITSRVSGRGSFVGKMWDALPNPLDKTSKNSESPTGHSDDNSPDSKVNNEGNHGNSFNSDMQNYTQNKQNLQEEFKDIRKQKQDLAAKYNSGKMSKEDYTSKFNSLDAKQISLTNDLDNMDRYIKAEETKAEAENNKKTINRMPEPHNNGGWMGKIQGAMGSGGSFRTKLSITAAALVAGNAVDAEAREIPVSAKVIPEQDEGLLKQATDMLGNLELAGGMATRFTIKSTNGLKLMLLMFKTFKLFEHLISSNYRYT